MLTPSIGYQPPPLTITGAWIDGFEDGRLPVSIIMMKLRADAASWCGRGHEMA